MGRLICFAYGSNMSCARLQARIPDARPLGSARLPGHALRFHKRGADGSAKLDAIPVPTATTQVLGVLYALSAAGKARLDTIEGPGYRVAPVRVLTPDDEAVEAFIYQAVDIDASLRPFHWYVHHVLTGAREAGLPTHYIEAIAATEAIDDPDPARDGRERAIHHRR
jgi:gamma-glutamylcyclotransferase (GGCT)/AIG2-like uncharacterized protein YtfP